MLAPRYVVFSALEGSLLGATSQSWTLAADALAELERRHVPLVLVTRGTRARLEPLRRKINHGHPFITESGGGLFLPDGYFPMHLEQAERVGRYFCVAFAQPYGRVTTALKEIAAEAGASVVGYSQMSNREIARNTGQTQREAELDRLREFSERFFFAGDAEAAAQRLLQSAVRHGWVAIPGNPFWELRSANHGHEARAVRYLMRLYRKALRSRLSSVGIGSTARDSSLLSAVDQAVVLPLKDHQFDPQLLSLLPHEHRGPAPGPEGWNSAVLELLGR
jgi:mannosyl-3-phosphoglycerate phosphatase family protein